MRVLVLAVTLLSLSWATNGTSIAPSMKFDHNASIVANDIYNMFWSIQTDEIIIEVHVKTLGYVGFGLSKTGGMKYADIVIGWVKAGKVIFQDRYAERNAEPKIDESQDWKLLEGKEEGLYTILKFSRNLTSCDPYDIDITDDTMRIIYAFHNEDPVESTGLKYHGSSQRGTKSLTLVSHLEKEEIVMPKDATSMDFKVQNIAIPAKDTTYYCQAFKIPLPAQKHHVVMVEPLIKAGNQGLVHHMILYACTDGILNDSHHGVHGDCEHQRMVAIKKSCYISLFLYAIGTEKTFLPKETGIPIGGTGSIKYLRLEIHYDNPPPSPAGLVDSSGMRLWLTPTLRKYDSWMLTTGLSVNKYHIIPPHFANFTTFGHCSSDCLSRGVGKDGIKIFGAALHSHLLGTNLKLRHIRNGVELPPIIKDDYYDFNFQYLKLRREPVTVLPTDDIIAECIYNSERRNGITYGGESTRDEMCLIFIMYYPRMANLSACVSMMPPQSTMEYTGAKIQPLGTGLDNFAVVGDKYTGKSWSQIITSEDWNDKTVRDNFQKTITAQNANQIMICDAHPNGQLVGKAIKITKPYNTTAKICESTYGRNMSPNFSPLIALITMMFGIINL